MQNDQFTQFKNMQKEVWSLFAPVETVTTPAAAKLVNYAKITSGEKVLDVGCGTGVVALTAARKGAVVKAQDLSPVLLERARINAEIAKVKIDFTEGDVEALPYKDNEFDVVLSQFGHMFAPRPEIAISEMLRVLRPGGRIAFSTWPPELYTGRMFSLTAKFMPPPEGVAPPPLWGDIKLIRDRLGQKVKDITFERDMLTPATLSPQHFRVFMESTAGPLTKLVQKLKDDAEKLESFRAEFESIISEYFIDNTIRQHFLMTKAIKV